VAESSLSLKFGDFMAYTGDYLGWGMGDTTPYSDVAWGARKTADLTKMVSSGVRMFYYPPILPGERKAHSWSFLDINSVTLTLAAAASTITLPDDFLSIAGPIGLITADGGPWPGDIKVRPGRDILSMFEGQPDRTGWPLAVAVEPIKDTALTTGQRFQLRVFPAADVLYTFNIRYKIAPDAITALKPYIYGGVQHSETVLAACMAAAEIYRDNLKPGEGARYAWFMSRLASSVSLDRDLSPELIGRNRDRSDDDMGRVRARGNGIVTVNGVIPE
jgi:hypothetical protein